MDEELFRKSSLDNLTAPEKGDAYIKVTKPGAWFVIVGILLLLVCAGLWSGVAGLKKTVPAPGVVHDGQIYAFVTPEQAKKLAVGMDVEEKNEPAGKITGISREIVSQKDAGKAYLTEYFRDTQLEKWNVEIRIDSTKKRPEGEEVSCSVVTDRVSLLELMTK